MEVCHHRPLVVSQALHLDSLDVEVVSTTLARAPLTGSLTVTKLAHPQASLAPLVASQLVSLGLPVVSSLLASLVLLAASLLQASTLLHDDNHDNTPKNMPITAGFTGLKLRKYEGRSSSLTKSEVRIRKLCTIA